MPPTLDELPMNDLFTLLQKIEKSPGMYIGRPAVTDLYLFLVGYEFARSEIDIELTPPAARFYREFQPWLQRKMGVKTVTSWAKLIMLSCHDEKKGFESFYQLLAEFRNSEEMLDTGARSDLVHH